MSTFVTYKEIICDSNLCCQFFIRD